MYPAGSVKSSNISSHCSLVAQAVLDRTLLFLTQRISEARWDGTETIMQPEDDQQWLVTISRGRKGFGFSQPTNCNFVKTSPSQVAGTGDRQERAQFVRQVYWDDEPYLDRSHRMALGSPRSFIRSM